MKRLRIAVVGHVEHVTLGSTDRVPGPGEIVHLRDARFLPAGGGGIAFAQLRRSAAQVHLFTAVGNDDAGRAVEAQVAGGAPNVHVHAAVRPVDHPRVVVMVDAEGRRTIVVTRDPLQPAGDDLLPWTILANCDAVYFTGADPHSLRLCRVAPLLVVTARRSAVIRAAGIAPDVILGSVSDPRENAPLDSYDPRPAALVLTDGPRPIQIFERGRTSQVDAPPAPEHVAGDYGAGDSFAGAFTFFLAHGLGVAESARRAGPYGAAVLRGVDPLEVQATLVAPGVPS
jgi:ribokinase